MSSFNLPNTFGASPYSDAMTAAAQYGVRDGQAGHRTGIGAVIGRVIMLLGDSAHSRAEITQEYLRLVVDAARGWDDLAEEILENVQEAYREGNPL